MMITERDVGVLGRNSKPCFKKFSDAKESAAFRAIRIASDVLGPRGDENCGCREEWLVFSSIIGKRSCFTTYRTNRFNNTFENALAVFSS